MSQVSELTICCSNCDKPIAGVLIVGPDAPVSEKLRVKCPFCNDYSFLMEVHGAICFGGVAMPNPNDPKDEIPLTVHVDTIYEDDMTVTYIMKKEKTNADPAKCRA